MTSGIQGICGECGGQFVVPAAEAQFRADRGLEAPSRCPSCRASNRASRNTDLIALYERAESFSLQATTPSGGRAHPDARNRGPRRASVIRQRYATVCDACGGETLVPFVPRGDRPVYCKDCFNARKGL